MITVFYQFSFVVRLSILKLKVPDTSFFLNILLNKDIVLAICFKHEWICTPLVFRSFYQFV